VEGDPMATGFGVDVRIYDKCVPDEFWHRMRG